jgi:hypothetical protein
VLARATAAPDWPWNVVLPVSFAIGSARSALVTALVPTLIGSHATIYTAATRAWLAGGDPWSVGPPEVVFAGPPPMLAMFLPFVWLSDDAIRLVWVAGSVAIAAWMLRRLGLPGYWIGFPPLFDVLVLGHPEVVVIALLLFGGVLGGLAMIVKPYLALALLAERRWRAIAVGLIAFVATLPFLPWPRFLAELPMITANLGRQYVGDGVTATLVPMAIAAIALLALGPRLALWLATPLLWPYSQPIYQTMTLPVITPLIAALWALPLPGATLVGVAAQAIVVQLGRRRELPRWLAAGIQPAAHGTTSREVEPAPIVAAFAALRRRLPSGRLAS